LEKSFGVLQLVQEKRFLLSLVENHLLLFLIQQT